MASRRTVNQRLRDGIDDWMHDNQDVLRIDRNFVVEYNGRNIVVHFARNGHVYHLVPAQGTVGEMCESLRQFILATR